MTTQNPDPLEQQVIQKKCEEFLAQLGGAGFIVFGWQKQNDEFGVVSSYRNMPANAAVKGLSWALNDFVSKSL